MLRRFFRRQGIAVTRAEGLDLMLKRWPEEKVRPLPAETPDAVRAAFAAVGAVATADVIELYGAIGGMQCMDDAYWRLWPLEELRDQPASEHGPVFSDYLMSCWSYRLKPVSAVVSAVYVDRHEAPGPRLVAPSLHTFFQRLAADPHGLLESR